MSKRKPDDGPMPKSVTKDVPRMKKGFLPGTVTGETTYTPDPKKPHVKRFKQSPVNDAEGVTGRVVDPNGPKLLTGEPDPVRSAMRKGRPVAAKYDGSAGAKVVQKIEQFDEGLRRSFGSGKRKK
jgi:hypothetical protein